MSGYLRRLAAAASIETPAVEPAPLAAAASVLDDPFESVDVRRADGSDTPPTPVVVGGRAGTMPPDEMGVVRPRGIRPSVVRDVPDVWPHADPPSAPSSGQAPAVSPVATSMSVGSVGSPSQARQVPGTPSVEPLLAVDPPVARAGAATVEMAEPPSVEVGSRITEPAQAEPSGGLRDADSFFASLGVDLGSPSPVAPPAPHVPAVTPLPAPARVEVLPSAPSPQPPAAPTRTLHVGRIDVTVRMIAAPAPAPAGPTPRTRVVTAPRRAKPQISGPGGTARFGLGQV